MHDTVPEDLGSEALRRALVARRPRPSWSCTPTTCRRGGTWCSQYTATRFKDLVAKHGALQRMSRRGNCYDNAERWHSALA